jgi:hypothetical protein
LFILWADSGRNCSTWGIGLPTLARYGARFFDSDGKILINTKRRVKSMLARQ